MVKLTRDPVQAGVLEQTDRGSASKTHGLMLLKEAQWPQVRLYWSPPQLGNRNRKGDSAGTLGLPTSFTMVKIRASAQRRHAL